jgi:hypothetical protein
MFKTNADDMTATVATLHRQRSEALLTSNQELLRHASLHTTAADVRSLSTDAATATLVSHQGDKTQWLPPTGNSGLPSFFDGGDAPGDNAAVGSFGSSIPFR